MTGILIKRNKSKHAVIRLHYSADLDKSPNTKIGRAWLEEEERKYVDGRSDLKWRQEMEIDFDAGVGELVFPWFLDKEPSLIVEPHKFNENWQFYGGFDWGIRNPTCFVVAAVDAEQNIEFCWELYVSGHGLREVARQIRECPFYSQLRWISCDPSIFSNTVAIKDGFTSLATMLFDEQQMGEFRLNNLIQAHGRSDGDYINLFKLLVLESENPKIKFWPGVVNLRQELRNLKHPKNHTNGNLPEKILNLNNHAWDASKYILLSHPVGHLGKHKLKYGTYEYVQKAMEKANELAGILETDVQDEFNKIYGTEITE